MKDSAYGEASEILIVEQSSAEITLLSLLLGKAGYQTRVAGSGEVALWAALRRPPDLILLASDLPGIDSYEACRSFKANPATASVPVIFISGPSGATERIAAFDAGAVDCIASPFAESEVLARIRTHVEMARTARRLLAQRQALELGATPIGRRVPEILIVEDTPESLYLLEKVLGDAGYTVREAPNGELALWSALRRPPDLVLLDIRMPGLNGFDVCRTLKAEPATAQVPVIFLSALSDIGDKEAGFAAGAVDFVAKPFSEQEVLARVRTHLRLAEAITAGPVAGELPEAAWQPASHPVEDFDRAFDVLDSPTLLVDGAGRITHVNSALQRLVGGTVAEWVGSRFDGLLSDAGSPLLAASGGCGEIRFEAADGRLLVCPAVATVLVNDAGATVRRVLVVHCSTDRRLAAPALTVSPATVGDAALEGSLREALGKDEFHLLYQPIVCLASGARVGAEALLRWHVPGRGWLMPVEFLSLAEDTGDIVAIGEWVLDRVCAELSGRRKDIPDNFVVTVNLSSLEFWQDRLVSHVESALSRWRIAGEALSFDIDAQVLDEDPVQALAVLRRLKGLGVGLTLDGWGNGGWYTERVGSFPVDGVKLSRSLAQRVLADPGQRSPMMSAVHQVRQLGLRTTISGIESPDEETVARQCGFAFAQGYRWSTPCALDDLIAAPGLAS